MLCFPYSRQPLLLEPEPPPPSLPLDVIATNMIPKMPTIGNKRSNIGAMKIQNTRKRGTNMVISNMFGIKFQIN